MFGRIILFDGRNGSVLSWMQTPDRREIYYPPQLLNGLDGEQFVLFGTGGNSRSGSLYIISLNDLFKRDISKVSNKSAVDCHHQLAEKWQDPDKVTLISDPIYLRLIKGHADLQGPSQRDADPGCLGGCQRGRPR